MFQFRILSSLLISFLCADVALAIDRVLVEPTRHLPNLLCQYRQRGAEWQLFAINLSKSNFNGAIHFGNSFAATYDSPAPGLGLCSARDRDESGEMIAFKIFVFKFEKETALIPGTCDSRSDGMVEVVDKVKVKPGPGITTTMTLQRPSGSKHRYINYFLTPEDEKAWPHHPDLAPAKCRELLTDP